MKWQIASGQDMCSYDVWEDPRGGRAILSAMAKEHSLEESSCALCPDRAEGQLTSYTTEEHNVVPPPRYH